MKLISFLLLNFSFHLWIASFLCLNIFVPAAHSFIQVKNKLFCGVYTSLGHYGYRTGTSFRPLSRPSLMILSSFKGVFRRLLRGHVSWADFPVIFHGIFHEHLLWDSFRVNIPGNLSRAYFTSLFHKHLLWQTLRCINLFLLSSRCINLSRLISRCINLFLFSSRCINLFF